MDEVQMVESSTSNATRVARRLLRVHSWGMSGTPVGPNGLDDLRGLLKFIDQDGVYTRHWKTFSLRDCLPSHLLRSLVHKNTKDNIGAELTLPSQEESTLYLSFSPIEKHYYDQVQRECREDILRIDLERQKYLVAGREPLPSVVLPMRSWLTRLRQIW